MNLKVEFRNFKKLKDLEAEFTSGNIYVIGGANNVGKTSFLQGINVLATGINKGKNLVSHGEQDGFIRGQFNFEGANKGRYIVKWDFDNNKDSFTIIDPETKSHKSNSRNNIIADIFQYNNFTIEDWFGWGLTAEGRRKQADIILNLLPEEAKEEYLIIDANVNSSYGIKYKERTEANKVYESNVKVIEAYKLTEEETKELDNKDKYSELLSKLKVDYEAAIKLGNPKEKIKEHHKEIQHIMDNAYVNETNKESEIIDLESEIKALQEQIAKKQAKILEHKESILKMAQIASNDIKKLEDNIKVLESTTGSDIDIDKIKERITLGEQKVSYISSLETKKQNYDKTLTELNQSYDKYVAIDKDIKDMSKRKIAIIEENNLPVSNITIENNEAFYVDQDGNNIPFVRDNLSYSEGGMVIAELMANINKTLPIWLIGSAESYDNTRLDKLRELVEKHDGIIFLDRVIPDSEQELTITCINK